MAEIRHHKRINIDVCPTGSENTNSRFEEVTHLASHTGRSQPSDLGTDPRQGWGRIYKWQVSMHEPEKQTKTREWARKLPKQMKMMQVKEIPLSHRRDGRSKPPRCSEEQPSCKGVRDTREYCSMDTFGREGKSCRYLHLK